MVRILLFCGALWFDFGFAIHQLGFHYWKCGPEVDEGGKALYFRGVGGIKWTVLFHS